MKTRVTRLKIPFLSFFFSLILFRPPKDKRGAVLNGKLQPEQNLALGARYSFRTLNKAPVSCAGSAHSSANPGTVLHNHPLTYPVEWRYARSPAGWSRKTRGNSHLYQFMPADGKACNTANGKSKGRRVKREIEVAECIYREEENIDVPKRKGGTKSMSKILLFSFL